MHSRRAIEAFRQKVLVFYATHRRDLPWRRTTDPYHILVSEIMLQQTQVDRVIPYYERWVGRWPTVRDLATASRYDVLKAWMGLGYNKRALSLLRTSRIIMERFQGDVLAALDHYKDLPGIGQYTRQAVVIFATNADAIAVDTNIRRILIHEFHIKTPTDAELWTLAERCLPRGRCCEWHNALMDYGSLLATAKRTGIASRTKQSRFEGSDRQIRAAVVRALVSKRKGATMREQALLNAIGIPCTQTRLRRVLSGLLKDGVIRKQGTTYGLA